MSKKSQFLSRLMSWKGYSESDGRYKQIIDIYNTLVPLPVGYQMKYSDPWCAATVSAAARSENLTDIIYPECSCARMVKEFKRHNRWKDKGYTPAAGDIIFYDWNGDGVSDHVGVVTKSGNGQIITIEGNINDEVGSRTVSVNNQYILGYGTPQYEEETDMLSVSPDHPDFTAEQFLNLIKPFVLFDMKQTGILASLTAAQALLESGRGNSKLTRYYNNLFGMKATSTWTGDVVELPTTEYYNGQPQTVMAKWRVYPDWSKSINDHSSLFLKYDRYANLRGETDYKQACINVSADGYATSPTYSDSLIKIIETYKLYEWDNEVIHGTDDVILRYGSTGEYVKILQQMLIDNGYSVGIDGVDGVIGDMTYRALVLWMYDHKMVTYKM